MCTPSCALFNFYTLPSVYVPPKPVAKDFPDAGLVILEDVGTLEYRVISLENGESRLVAVLDHRRKMKILRESGLAAADVSLPVDGFSTVTRTVARSVTAAGHTSNMSSRAVTTEPRNGLFQQAPDVKTMRFHIPDGEVGGLLEYRYERVYTDPLLVDPWVFGDAMPVLRSEFNLVTSPEAELDYAYGHGEQILDTPPKRTQTADGRDQFTFVERDLPPSFTEPLMPNLAHVVPWIAVVVRAVRGDGGALHLDTWAAVADRVWADLTAIAVRPAEGTVIERYEQVRKGLTPLLLPGLGIHPPVPGDALSQGTPACPRDATSVLLQSLVGVELEAYPALLTGATGVPVAESVPGYYPFVHTVAALRVGEKLIADQQCTGDYLKRSSLCGMDPNSLLYLDPLCKDCAFGVLPAEYAGGRALILEPNNPHWVTMALDPPERHASTIHYLWAFDHSGAFNGTVGGGATRHAGAAGTPGAAQARGQQRQRRRNGGARQHHQRHPGPRCRRPQDPRRQTAGPKPPQQVLWAAGPSALRCHATRPRPFSHCHPRSGGQQHPRQLAPGSPAPRSHRRPLLAGDPGRDHPPRGLPRAYRPARQNIHALWRIRRWLRLTRRQAALRPSHGAQSAHRIPRGLASLRRVFPAGARRGERRAHPARRHGAGPRQPLIRPHLRTSTDKLPSQRAVHSPYGA